MKKINFIFLSLLISLLVACITIPRESVDLSSEIGVGLKKQHQSQIDLVNLHFSIQRETLDKAMNKAITSYFSDMTPNDSIVFNRSQLNDVASDVLSFNDENNAAKEELEKTRIWLIKKLNDNYLALNQANSTVTGLLQSAVDVKGSSIKAYNKLSEATGGVIDLNKIFTVIEDFALKKGEEAGKAIMLVEKVESLINSNSNNKGGKQ